MTWQQYPDVVVAAPGPSLGPQAGSVDLNKANIESEMAGKNSFIKFQAPW